jgi:S-DNA-T family DNA segregation ATPase FtsK/SpoIIIE
VYVANKISADIHFVNLNNEFMQVKKISNPMVYDTQDGIYDLLITLKKEFRARSSRKKAVLSEGVNDFYSVIMKEFSPLVVIIDDFDAFLQKIYDTSYKEEMNKIVELFFKEGKQLGIMFIAGFTPEFASNNLYTQACRNFTLYKTGVHIGGRLNDQRIFEFSLPLAVQTQVLSDQIGYSMKKGVPYKLFIPQYEIEDND